MKEFWAIFSKIKLFLVGWCNNGEKIEEFLKIVESLSSQKIK